MARKCRNCGAPAPDTSSRFCDLCGAPLIDDPVAPQGLPVCPSCGAIISDKKAQFCDVCGTPLAKPVCPLCGTPAQSSRSKFCTRCGATFGSPVPGKSRKSTVSPGAIEKEPEPVVVRPRKGRVHGPEPAPTHTVEEWDPWTDGDPLYDISSPLPVQPQQRPLTDLERFAAGVPQPKSPKKAQGIGDLHSSGQQKKYSHLPLVADELREEAERRRAANDAAESKGNSGRKGKQEKKGGMFKFLS